MHRDELDLRLNSDLSPEDHARKGKYKQAVRIYDRFEDKDAFRELLGELKPRTVVKYFRQNGEIRHQLKRRAEEHRMAITYDGASERYQIRGLLGQDAPIESISALARYSSCRELIQQRKNFDLTARMGPFGNNSFRKSDYKRTLEIYDQFKGRDAFMELFGELAPKTIRTYFSKSWEKKGHVRKCAEKHHMAITFDSEIQKYQVERLSNERNNQGQGGGR